MDRKITTDLREVSGTVYFGLNLRQLVSSAVGIVLSVLVWVSFCDTLGNQYTSWLCCAAVAPCACIGFVKIQGQPFERFALAWLRFQFLEGKELSWKSNDINVLLLSKKLNSIKRKTKTSNMDGGNANNEKP